MSPRRSSVPSGANCLTTTNPSDRGFEYLQPRSVAETHHRTGLRDGQRHSVELRSISRQHVQGTGQHIYGNQRRRCQKHWRYEKFQLDPDSNPWQRSAQHKYHDVSDAEQRVGQWPRKCDLQRHRRSAEQQPEPSFFASDGHLDQLLSRGSQCAESILPGRSMARLERSRFQELRRAEP